jgi:hypothetical protein
VGFRGRGPQTTWALIDPEPFVLLIADLYWRDFLWIHSLDDPLLAAGALTEDEFLGSWR